MAQTAPYGAWPSAISDVGAFRSAPTWAQELEVASGWMAKALDWEEGLAARDALTAAMTDVREVRYAGA